MLNLTIKFKAIHTGVCNVSIDIININGSLDKIDKFWRIRLFCDNHHSCQGIYRALVTTNASNVGIDKHSIALQVQFNGPVISSRTFKREEEDLGHRV